MHVLLFESSALYTRTLPFAYSVSLARLDGDVYTNTSARS